jgi:hypothetical protein
MRYELIAGVDATSPIHSLRIETNLISLGRINALKAGLCRADGERVTVNDPWHAG